MSFVKKLQQITLQHNFKSSRPTSFCPSPSKTKFLPTLLSAALVALTQAQDSDSYSSVCSSLWDGAAHEINPDYFVQVKCDTLGPNDGQPLHSITSARACAEKCQQAAGCVGSSWVATLNLCYLNNGLSGDGTTHSNTAYLKHVAAPECESCNRELSDVKAQLAACQAKLPQQQVNYCQGKTGYNVPSFIVTERNRQYRVTCNLAQNGVNDDAKKGVKTSQECAEACTSTTAFKCVYALWEPSGNCYLRRAGDKDKLTLQLNNWVSMQLV